MKSDRNHRLQQGTRTPGPILTIASALILIFVIAIAGVNAQSAPPDIGQRAPDFVLHTPEGVTVKFNDLLKQGKVVLIVLRGYPGYQCPYCQRQVHDFVQHAAEFAQAGAQVLLVYPGPPAQLDAHAKEFLSHEPLPSNVRLVIDPEYKITNLYGLRWDAPGETAYPSTFIVNRREVILFRKISHSHGDRTVASDVLAELNRQKAD
jgi:peroxiredoxin